MDDDAKQSNTDCVYFLASPLTCKKGNNCEFRHSEAARMNPRDCWYWTHSSCRNPNCSFRHLPLEGQSGTCVSPKPAATAPHAATTGVSTASLASKLKTPCYFFSQGNCTKGDKCPFMHGLALPTSADAVSQLKQPKSPERNHPTGSKPAPVLKSVALNVSRSAASEHAEKKFSAPNKSYPVSLKTSSISVQEKPQLAKAAEETKALEILTAGNPYRIEKTPVGRKSRVTLFSDAPDDFMDLKDERHVEAFNIAEKRQVHSGRKQQQPAQYEQKKSNSTRTADHRYQNGGKSDAWWKNDSSGVDNDGLGLYLHGEDGEYSPRATSRRRPKVFDDTASWGRPKGFDDTASRGYKEPHSYVPKGPHSHVRDGFGTRPPDHRQLHSLQHEEQQMQSESDYNGTADLYHGATSGGRITVRDGQRTISEGYMSKIDLRDHLLKRRRDDRGHPSRNGIFSRKGPLDMTDTPYLSQRPDDGFISNGPRGGVLLKKVDHRGIKRLRHDPGASPDGRLSKTSPIRQAGHGRSPDRTLPVVSSNRHSGLDFSRNGGKERRRDCYGSKVVPLSNVKSHSPASQVMKSVYVKEITGFTGPKSLAQIKAEKKVESDYRVDQGLVDRVKHLDEDSKLTDLSSPIPANQEHSIASTSQLKRLHTERAFAGKTLHTPASSEDFEGPKRLSLLLKEKQVESDTNSRLDQTTFEESEDAIINSNREVEDGEVRDEEDEYMESPNELLQEEIAPVTKSNPIMKASEAETNQGVGDVQDDLGSSEDEIGLELGQTMLGDEDYDDDDDDDDEDDFAKKLGGMYS